VRHHDFEGCFNFRDLGGWKTAEGASVRWGRLFRSDAVHLMTPDDVLRAHQQLGLRTIIDLRSEIEIEFGGMGGLADIVSARHHVPLSSRRATTAVDATVALASSDDRSPDAMVDQYLAILEGSSDLVVGAVAALASADALPGVFFCAAGKDRTGVLSAVVLGALGIRDEDIVEDYVLTGDSIDRIIGRFASTPGSPAMYRDNPPSHFAPYRETMERVIGGVRDQYGSFGAYLVAKGLPTPALEALAATLLDPDG
jgi:protein-tyrosine phosphatase